MGSVSCNLSASFKWDVDIPEPSKQRLEARWTRDFCTWEVVRSDRNFSVLSKQQNISFSLRTLNVLCFRFATMSGNQGVVPWAASLPKFLDLSRIHLPSVSPFSLSVFYQHINRLSLFGWIGWNEFGIFADRFLHFVLLSLRYGHYIQQRWTSNRTGTQDYEGGRQTDCRNRPGVDPARKLSRCSYPTSFSVIKR